MRIVKLRESEYYELKGLAKENIKHLKFQISEWENDLVEPSPLNEDEKNQIIYDCKMGLVLWENIDKAFDNGIYVEK